MSDKLGDPTQLAANAPDRKDDEQSLELRWIPGRGGIRVYIWEGKELVQSSYHPTHLIREAMESAYRQYGAWVDNGRQ